MPGPVRGQAAEASRARRRRTTTSSSWVELAGGNDGLEHRRPVRETPSTTRTGGALIGLPKKEVLKLNDLVGLHPRMGPMLADLFKAGRAWRSSRGVALPEARPLALPIDGDLAHRERRTHPADLRLARPMPRRHRAARRPGPRAGDVALRVAPAGVPGRSGGRPGGRPARTPSTRRPTPTTAGSASPPPTPDHRPRRAPGRCFGFLRRQSEAVYRTADRLKQATEKYKSERRILPGGPLGHHLRRAAL